MNTKPNILWIVSDHQIHATRPPGFNEFPLQRKLAQLGTEFTRAYSVLPICSPARASMLTGLYPHAHGLTENDGRFGGREGLHPDDWMIHKPLLEAGYRCGWFGKWHVDNQRSAQDYGFEGFSLPGYGYPYGCQAYREYLQRKGLEEPIAKVTIENESGVARGSEIKLCEEADWFDPVSGVFTLDNPMQVHEAFFVSDLAAQWIDSVQDNAFFLRVDPWGPHPPYLLAEPFFNMLDKHEMELPSNFHADLEQRPDHHRRYRDYWRSAVNLSEEQWRKQYQHALEHTILVETALCQLLENIDPENTIVIFNSDHGDAVGSNGGIANKGDSMAEATMQIPLLFAGNGIPSSASQSQLVSNLDIAPTVLDLCGVDCVRELHGVSVADTLVNRPKLNNRGLLSQHYGLGEPIVQRAWYRDSLKLVVGQDGYRELYDLENDPDELENLALNFEYRKTLKSMERELRQRMSRVSDNNEQIIQALDSQSNK